MSSDSGGKRSPDEGAEAQSITDSSPANDPMKEPPRKPHRAQKVPGSVNEKARRRGQGSSRPLPPTSLPLLENTCVVTAPATTIPLGTHLAPTGSQMTTRAASRKPEFTQGTVASDLSSHPQHEELPHLLHITEGPRAARLGKPCPPGAPPAGAPIHQARLPAGGPLLPFCDW